jgi:hypothetical protein
MALNLRVLLGALGVALFDVEGGGQPQVRLHVGAPAIEVVELLHGLDGAGEVAVEADHVAVAVSTQMRPKKRPYSFCR